MPTILFEHPKIDTALSVETGANDISWSYNLNTQAYPTYGGEVVQVLSTNIQNLTIKGQVRSYEKMEEIYKWFLKYMMIATQGIGKEEGYVEIPVTMTYPHRGWQMAIKPMQLPNMRYGRDVVVPEWQMVAHIVVPDAETQELAIDHGVGSLVGGELANVKKRISADIGFRRQNPFSDPHGLLTKEERALYYGNEDLPQGIHVQGEKLDESILAEETKAAVKYIGKQMSAMFEKLIDGTVEDLFGNLPDWVGGDASKPSKTRKAADKKDKPDETQTAIEKKRDNRRSGNAER